MKLALAVHKIRYKTCGNNIVIKKILEECHYLTMEQHLVNAVTGTNCVDGWFQRHLVQHSCEVLHTTFGTKFKTPEWSGALPPKLISTVADEPHILIKRVGMKTYFTRVNYVI